MAYPAAVTLPDHTPVLFKVKTTVSTADHGGTKILLNLSIDLPEIKAANKTTRTEYTIAFLHNPHLHLPANLKDKSGAISKRIDKKELS